MKVSIKIINGKTCDIEVLETDSISNLKEKINDKVNISPSKQILEFKGQLLEDKKCLKDYNIESKSILELSITEGVCMKVGSIKGQLTL